MAKKPAAVKSAINVALLSAIANAPTGVYYVTQDEGAPLLAHNPQLIEVNTTIADPSDPNKRAARATQAGKDYLAALAAPAAAGEASAAPVASSFAIITNAAIPASKRGNRGGGAPNKYPFAQLEVGQSFFVPKSEKVPDPVKTLGSAISSANMRYAEDTGETKQVERAKRGAGNKAVKDAAGNTIKETKTVPVYKLTRKFVIRSIETGKTYGGWTAPNDGALIARVPVE